MLFQQVGPIRGSYLVLDVSVNASICIDLYRRMQSTRGATHRFDLVQLPSMTGVAQRSPLLHEVEPKHRRETGVKTGVQNWGQSALPATKKSKQARESAT
jgi:hypothetical protein